jgi:hypothetical protein
MSVYRRHHQDVRMPVDVFALDDDDGDARRRERLGRWLMIIGVVIAAAGCIVWVYVILRERGVTDDDTDLVPGVSAPVVGFVAIVVGLAIASIGSARSRDR